MLSALDTSTPIDRLLESKATTPKKVPSSREREIILHDCKAQCRDIISQGKRTAEAARQRLARTVLIGFFNTILAVITRKLSRPTKLLNAVP